MTFTRTRLFASALAALGLLASASAFTASAQPFGFGFGFADTVPRDAAICVFDQAGFEGTRECFPKGTYDRLPSFWDDRIESILVGPGVEVTACRNIDFGGFCQTFSFDQSGLGPLFAAISSMDIR